MFRLENDIMSEMETRSAVPAASEAAPRQENRAPRNVKDRIALSKSLQGESGGLGVRLG